MGAGKIVYCEPPDRFPSLPRRNGSMTSTDVLLSAKTASVLKPGDVVHYAAPLPGEGDARFLVIEAHYDVPVPRALVRLLDSGMRIVPEELRPASEYELASAK